MREVRINLNEWVKVKLTDYAKDIYYHRFDGVNERVGRVICKPSYPREDEERYSKFQLWDFMNLYGEYMRLGNQEILNPLEIVYEMEDDDDK